MSDISAWSTSASDNNAATPDGWPEGQTAGSVNDCGREVMAALRRQHEQAEWIDLGDVPTKVDSDTFTIPGDVTATYHAGRRVRVSGTGTGYSNIASVSYSDPNTTINLNDAVVPGSLYAVAVGILSRDSFPGDLISASNGQITVNTAAGVSVTSAQASFPPGLYLISACFETLDSNFSTGLSDVSFKLSSSSSITGEVAFFGERDGARLKTASDPQNRSRIERVFFYRNAGSGAVTLYMRSWVNFTGGVLATNGWFEAIRLR